LLPQKLELTNNSFYNDLIEFFIEKFQVNSVDFLSFIVNMAEFNAQLTLFSIENTMYSSLGFQAFIGVYYCIHEYPSAFFNLLKDRRDALNAIINSNLLHSRFSSFVIQHRSAAMCFATLALGGIFASCSKNVEIVGAVVATVAALPGTIVPILRDQYFIPGTSGPILRDL